MEGARIPNQTESVVKEVLVRRLIESHLYTDIKGNLAKHTVGECTWANVDLHCKLLQTNSDFELTGKEISRLIPYI